jgi:hypothetical protein
MTPAADTRSTKRPRRDSSQPNANNHYGEHKLHEQTTTPTSNTRISQNDLVIKLLQSQMEALQTKLVDINSHVSDIKHSQYEIKQNQQEINYRLTTME